MLNGTTLGRLASNSFFIASDFLHRPASRQTGIQFTNGDETVFFSKLARLDEIEQFDLIGGSEHIKEQKIIFLRNALLEAGIANDAANSSSYANGLRYLIKHVLFDVFPSMYRFGGHEGGWQPPKEERADAIREVFDRLCLKYGQSPPENMSLEQVIGALKNTHFSQNVRPVPIFPVGNALAYPEQEAHAVLAEFPSQSGESALSQLFDGKPYFVREGRLYKLETGLKRSGAAIITPNVRFGLQECEAFNTLDGVYRNLLRTRFQFEAISELETNTPSLGARYNPEWYVGKLVEDGHFEWDNVGFFVARFIERTPTCYVYRRINKFARADLSINPSDSDATICHPYGETRVGLQLRLEDCRILLGSKSTIRPVVIDAIGHKAEVYEEWGFKGICNDSTYSGDIANIISEGIATLRHSPLYERRYGINSRLTVRDARQQGYDIIWGARR